MTTPMDVLVRNEAECAYELAWLKGLIELGAVRQYEKELADLTERHREAVEAHAAVAELIEADEEYDAAVTAHKDLVRRIAEQGWYEIQTDALRNAGVRTDRAQARRAAALAGVGGAK